MTDLSSERAEVRQRFANLRHFTSLVITQREKLNTDFGLDEDEIIDQLKHIVAVFSEEERILLEMLAEEDVVDDAMLNWREAKKYVK
jgi:hypothetical protein